MRFGRLTVVAGALPLALVLAAPPVTGQSGLVRHWTADNTAVDVVGGAVATLLNGAAFGPGRIGQAFVLDGVDDEVDAGTRSGDYPAGSFTMAAWVRSAPVGAGSRTVMQKYECGGPSCLSNPPSLMSLYFDANGLAGWVRDADGGGPDTGGQIVYGPAGVADGAFHHVAFVRDLAASTLTVYLDGAVVATEALEPTAAGELVEGNDGDDDPLTIGFGIGVSNLHAGHVAGAVDDARLYHTALSAAEVATLALVQPPDPTPPTAVLVGPQSIAAGQDLTVDGGRSFDTGGTIVRYEWTLQGFPTVATTSAAFTFTATLYPLAPGRYTVQLVVVDDSGNRSSPDTVATDVVGDIDNPTAVLVGPQSITAGQDLTVDGGRSFDTGGTIVRYEWTLQGFPTVATTTAAFTFTAALYPLAPGRYTVQLVVVDDSGNRSSPDTVATDVVGDIDNPTAVLVGPQSITAGQDLTVDGGRSFDTGGAIVRYEWTLDAFAPVETDTPAFTFTAAAYPLGDGEHTVQLVVVDDSGNRSSPDDIRVTVEARADTVQLHLHVEGLGGLPATVTVRASARYLTLPAGVSDPLLPSAPPCANAADCLFAPRAGSTVVIDVDPGGNILTGPFVAGWTGCDAQANGRCYVTVTQDRTATVRVSPTRPVFAVGTTGGALFSSTAGPGVLAFAAARTAAGDLLGGSAVLGTATAQYACGAVAGVERSGNRTTLITRYGVKAPGQAGAAPVSGYSCRVSVTDATSRSGRDQFTIQVNSPSGAVEFTASGDASWLAFSTRTNVPVVW